MRNVVTVGRYKDRTNAMFELVHLLKMFPVELAYDLEALSKQVISRDSQGWWCLPDADSFWRQVLPMVQLVY